MVHRTRSDDEPAVDRQAVDRQVVDETDVRPSSMPMWSFAQLVGLIGGIGFAVLGIAAVAKTGFDTDHIYTPHVVVWHLPASPLFAVIEIAFGVLLILASIVPGGARPILAFLGAAALVFGIVVLTTSDTSHLNRWLASTRRTGWLYTIYGAVLLLTALIAPTFGRSRTRARRVTEPVENEPEVS